MYYFYLIESLNGRAGFGIAQDIKDRSQKYISHSGGMVKMHVYTGLRAHCKALERTIKVQYSDNLWQVGEWKTEWLKDEISLKELEDYVGDLIKERHYNIRLLIRDYNFTQEILE